MTSIPHLDRLSPGRFETPNILKKLATASRKLAELKGVAASIPNQGILINTLAIQEAKDSSAIENIVTDFYLIRFITEICQLNRLSTTNIGSSICECDSY